MQAFLISPSVPVARPSGIAHAPKCATGTRMRSGVGSPELAHGHVVPLLAAVLATAVVSSARRRAGKPASAVRRRQTSRRRLVLQAASTEPTLEAPQSDASPDFRKLREDFPILQEEARAGVPIVYLDNAATSHKPRQVLEELMRFYNRDNSNVHRGMHTLSMRATEDFEEARAKIARFIHASDPSEVIFTRNASEAINLVALTWARANLKAGDEILLTVMEHHSNLVPWQMLAEEVGAKLRFVHLTPQGTLNLDELDGLLTQQTRLVSMCHVSNVLGCCNPIQSIARKAHAVGAKLLVDACQSVPHAPVDVQELEADWLVASSHKMCGPTGIGFLWGRAELLRAAPPLFGGGEMIDEVRLEGSTWNDIPYKFEAGTPAFAEAVALGSACDYLSGLGMEHIQAQELALTKHLWQRLAEIPGITLYGPTPDQDPERAALCSFNIEGCHPNDLATLVDQEAGVAMRSGHHCAQPLHKELGVTSSARLSAYFYNTTEEIDIAVAAVKDAADLLRGASEQMPMQSIEA